MPYPIIIPEYFEELSDETKVENVDNEYKILSTPAAVEYVFPLSTDTVINKLMEIKDPIAYKMVNMKPEAEAEYAEKGKKLIDETPILQYYWPLKTLTMNIVQNRSYMFEKRMLLLNFALNTAQNMINQGQKEIIPRFVADFTSRTEHEEVMKYFESIRAGFAFSLSNALSFLRVMPDRGGLGEVRKAVFESVGMDPEKDTADIDISKYKLIKKEYHEDFLKGREHYIENVMVNYVWYFCMPFADYKSDLWDNFLFYNVIFNAIKVMLTCYTYGKEDKDEAFRTAIKAFDTSLLSVGTNLVHTVAETLRGEDIANNGDMAILSMS